MVLDHRSVVAKPEPCEECEERAYERSELRILVCLSGEDEAVVRAALVFVQPVELPGRFLHPVDEFLVDSGDDFNETMMPQEIEVLALEERESDDLRCRQGLLELRIPSVVVSRGEAELQKPADVFPLVVASDDAVSAARRIKLHELPHGYGGRSHEALFRVPIPCLQLRREVGNGLFSEHFSCSPPHSLEHLAFRGAVGEISDEAEACFRVHISVQKPAAELANSFHALAYKLLSLRV